MVIKHYPDNEGQAPVFQTTSQMTRMGSYRIRHDGLGYMILDNLGMTYGESHYALQADAIAYVRRLLMAEAAQRKELSV